MAEILKQINLIDLANKIYFILSPICNINTQDMVSTIVDPYLSYKDTQSLLCTNRFFSNNSLLIDTMNAKYEGKVILKCTYRHTFFWDKGENILYWYGNDKGQLLQFALPDNEIPVNINATTSFFLILCRSGKLFKHSFDSYSFEPCISLEQVKISGNEKIFKLFDSDDDSVCHAVIMSESYKLYQIGKPTKVDFLEVINLPKEEQPINVVVDVGTIILCKSGKLYSYGDNYFGQLGLGEENIRKNIKIPQQIHLPFDDLATTVVVGNDRTFVLCKSNRCYAFGKNKFGELGLSRVKREYGAPELLPIPSFEAPKKIVLGHRSGLVLCESGNIFGFGENQIVYTQLLTPFPSPSNEIIKDVMLSCAISGDPNKYTSNILVLCNSGNYFSLGLWPSGRFNDDKFKTFELPENEVVKKIFTRNDSVYLFCSSNNFYKLSIESAKGKVKINPVEWELKRCVNINEMVLKLKEEIKDISNSSLVNYRSC
ncbi:MAG: hypothetical protein H0U57_06595 [Tatlockia sp.]|nr:hypothetical protein [Tatlockia sp.]